ncbi:host attachment protein [Chitinolyticbacter meiyuanensis]|uniref:host attachment protein n=1 Tax=Chitinolyticbacter meiyuanensis TaxID=682798 RepID=UPI00165201CD|nr:host attachment protein [Chitinolyticbacter meiyuanensis]
MPVTWILAADSSRAHIFEIDAQHHATEVEHFSHEATQLQNRELNTDAYGRYAGGGQGKRGHTTQPAVEATEHEAQRFSKELGLYLERARQEHRFDRLKVVAPPKFLGLMRQQLSKSAQALIDEELPRDVSKLDAHAIEQYFETHVLH